MIYEVRTYSLKPRALPEVEKLFEEGLAARQKYSPLAAFFHTEIGPLNQIIHIWPYDSAEERTRIRARTVSKPQKGLEPAFIWSDVFTEEADAWSTRIIQEFDTWEDYWSVK